MVVIADQFVTPARSICSAAHSRSQRDSNTKVAAVWRGAFMQACMPVTWNIGNADSTTVSSTVPRQYMYGIVVACTLACVCMQPFGFPVVPEIGRASCRERVCELV